MGGAYQALPGEPHEQPRAAKVQHPENGSRKLFVIAQPVIPQREHRAPAASLTSVNRWPDAAIARRGTRARPHEALIHVNGFCAVLWQVERGADVA